MSSTEAYWQWRALHALFQSSSDGDDDLLLALLQQNQSHLLPNDVTVPRYDKALVSSIFLLVIINCLLTEPFYAGAVKSTLSE